MPSRNKNSSAGGKIHGPFQIGEGGHGKQTPREACLALGAFSRFDVGLGLNPIPLDADGKIPASYWGGIKLIEAGLDGPSVLNSGSLGVYFITTFDNFTSYDVTAPKGEIRRDGRIIYFRAPLEAGEVSFFVDAREYKVIVVGDVFQKPVILSPVNDFEDGNTSITIVSSMALIQGSPEQISHVSSDWEIYTNFDLKLLFKRAYKSLNKNSWTVTGLDLDTDYYVRVRYNSLTGEKKTSEWSEVIHFKTSEPKFVNQPSILHPSGVQSSVSSPLTISASVFLTTGYGASLDNPALLNHLSTDWLISTTEDFSQIVTMSTNDTVNKTSWTPNSLAELTLYYTKCRYRNTEKVSAWSVPVSFIIV